MNPRRNRLRLDRRGVTVIELLVGLSLAAVASVVVYTVFISTQGAFVDTRDVTSTQADARVVLGMLMQELRAAGSDPNDTDATVIEPFVTCYADTVRVQSDFDGNGTLDAMAEPPEDVVWFHDIGGETLVRRTPGGDMPILRNVTGFTVDYLDARGNELSGFPLDRKSRLLIRALRVELQVRVSRGLERSWTATAALRNDQPTL